MHRDNFGYKKVALYLIIFVGFIGILNISFSFGNENSDEGIRVKENSELTYYLDVMYDGKDKYVVTSSDAVVSQVYSGYIYVEDKLPEGLTFKDFVKTTDNSIGAVKRNGEGSCPGSIIDDSSEEYPDNIYNYHGLHYNKDTRTVSFAVKNLQAGCKLTVGIITTTPSLADYNTNRMDFWNYASAKEKDIFKYSNTVHTYIGKPTVTSYSVKYQYEGDIPENAPIIDNSITYVNGSTVGVASEPNIMGYIFSGWKTDDVEVTDGKFTMPEKDVTFTGTFTKKNPYRVKYLIKGDVPDGFLFPADKEYYENDAVIVDSLSLGDVIDGYRFLGWHLEDKLVDDIIMMPAHDIEIVGEFELISYSVTYQFIGEIIPTDSSAILPSVKNYKPGDNVVLETISEESMCIQPETGEMRKCSFLGWYKENEFIMPEEDIIISGEWKILNEYFSPVVNKTIINEQEYYSKDEEVLFKTTITNNQDYPIYDVVLKEHLEGCEFIPKDEYSLMNKSFAKISIIPAGSSVEVYSKYIPKNDLFKKYTSNIELTGALALNSNYLDVSKTYISGVEFNILNIRLDIELVDNNELQDDYVFGIYSLEQEELFTGKSFNELRPNNDYYLKEIKSPNGYILDNNMYLVHVDNEGNISIDGVELDNNDNVFLFVIQGEKIDILPNTGGPGIIWFSISGVLIILIGCLGYIIYLKRRKENMT